MKLLYQQVANITKQSLVVDAMARYSVLVDD